MRISRHFLPARLTSAAAKMAEEGDYCTTWLVLQCCQEPHLPLRYVRAHNYSCMVILVAVRSLLYTGEDLRVDGVINACLIPSRPVPRRLFPDTPCGKVCIASPQSSCCVRRYLETTANISPSTYLGLQVTDPFTTFL